MAFQIEFYVSGKCDKCKKGDASVHLSSRFRERQNNNYMDLCDSCWTHLDNKVRSNRYNVKQKDIADAATVRP